MALLWSWIMMLFCTWSCRSIPNEIFQCGLGNSKREIKPFETGRILKSEAGPVVLCWTSPTAHWLKGKNQLIDIMVLSIICWWTKDGRKEQTKKRRNERRKVGRKERTNEWTKGTNKWTNEPNLQVMYYFVLPFHLCSPKETEAPIVKRQSPCDQELKGGNIYKQKNK